MTALDSAHLLAARSDTEWIFGLIVGAIWVVFTIISTIAKKQQEELRKRQLQGQQAPGSLEAEVARQRALAQQQQLQQQRQRHVAQQTSRPVQQPAQRPGKRQKQKPRQPQRQPVPVRPAPPPIPVSPSPFATATRHNEIADIDAPRPSRTTAAAQANSLNQWLRPATLRQQFILTEILQPPLALRPPREH